MVVSDEAYGSQSDEGSFVDIQPQPPATRQRIAHPRFRVTVLSIEQLQEESRIVPPRRREPEFLDRRDLFLQLRPQFLVTKRVRPVDLHIGGLCDLVLLLRHRARGLLLLFRTRHLHGGLALSDCRSQAAAEENEKSPTHLFESDQVLDDAAKISAHLHITNEDKMLVDLVAGGGGLLSGARIHISDIELQAIKDGTALGRPRPS